MRKRHMLRLAWALITVFWIMFPMRPSWGAENPVVRVGHQPNINHVNVIVAEKKGFFKEEGLNIERKAFIAGAPLREAMITGSLDIGQLGSTPAISTAAAGVPVKAIFVNAGGGGQHSFIVRKDSPINDPCKTKGMRVGVFVGSLAHYAVMLAVEKRCGLSYKDYNFIMMEPPDAMVQLEAGLVDAIILWEDFGSVAVEGKKIGKRLIDAREATKAPTITMATEKFVEKHPDLVVKYIRASAKAMQFVVSNFDETVDIVTSEWKRPKEVTISAMNRMYYDPRITQDVIKDWKAEAEWQFKEKKIKKLPDWDRFIETRFVNEAVKGMNFDNPYVPGSVYLEKK